MAIGAQACRHRAARPRARVRADPLAGGQALSRRHARGHQLRAREPADPHPPDARRRSARCFRARGCRCSTTSRTTPARSRRTWSTARRASSTSIARARRARFGPGHADLPLAFHATGQPVLIGGTMGTASYILAGTARSAKLAFASACHGAGRSMSRHEATRRWAGPRRRRRSRRARHPRSAARRCAASPRRRRARTRTCRRSSTPPIAPDSRARSRGSSRSCASRADAGAAMHPHLAASRSEAAPRPRVSRRAAARRAAAAVCAAMWWLVPACAPCAGPAVDVRTATDAPAPAGWDAGYAAPRVDPAWFEQVYSRAAPGPVWFTVRWSARRPSPGRCASCGLPPTAASRPTTTTSTRSNAGSTRRCRRAVEPDAVARADLALSAAVLQFLADLRFGRVRAAAGRAPLPRRRRRTRRSRRSCARRWRAIALTDLIAAAEPAFPQYARLKRLLAEYRHLAARRAPALPPLASPRGKVVTGDAYAGAPALRDVLVRLGDLAADSARPADGPYSETLADGGAAVPGAARPGAGRHSRQGDARRAQRADRDARRPDRAVARAPALAARACRRPADRHQHSVVPAVGVRRRREAGARRCRCRSSSAGRCAARRRSSSARCATSSSARTGTCRRASCATSCCPGSTRDPSYLEREDMEIVSTRRDGGHVLPTTRPRSRPCVPARRACASVRARERARWRQVRAAQHDGHLPARDAGARAVRPHAARLQPRLHPRARPGGARVVRAARLAGMDAAAHRGGDDLRREPHGTARDADPGGRLLHDGDRRRRRSRDLSAPTSTATTAGCSPRCARHGREAR